MPGSEFTKAERKTLRELAGEAYEAEAKAFLGELADEFDLWRAGKVSSTDLLTSVHHFHQHQNRELWKAYQGVSDAMAVERGLELGLISEAKVGATLLAKIRRQGDFPNA